MDKVQAFAPSRLSPAELEARQAPSVRAAPAPGAAFADALQDAINTPLHFSTHAQERLRSRDIRLSASDTAELNRAVEMASAKGARESLIVYDDLALIVSIRNRVVITALERGEEQANVFTHIDSAVVLPGSRS